MNGASCSIFERYNLHKSRFLVFVVFGIFAFLKYLSQYTVLGDFIIGIITVLPFILLAVFFAWIYFRDRENHVLYQTMQKCDVFLKMSFKLSAAILILFIVFFPSAWRPLLKFFDVFRQLFSLETYFLFASYAAVIIVACGLIIFSIRLYQIGRGTYQKTVNHLIKKSLYSTFFVLLFLLLISVVTYPQAYYPITDAVSDGIYTISQGSIALTKLSGEDLQKTDSLFGLARRAISQTSDNLSGEIDTAKTNLLTNISQSKNILAQSISETQANLNEQISNRVSTEGGEITGDLEIAGLTTTEDIIPSDNLTYDLGSSSKAWNNLYVHSLFGASPITLNDSLVPASSAVNLGSSSNHFGTIYADSLVGVSLNYLPLAGGTITGSLIPSVDTINLGSDANHFGTIYADALIGVTGSQWTTSSVDIYYNDGNVGIGTDNPEAALSVEGNIITGDLSSNSITSSSLSAIIGGENNTVTGNQSVIIGGEQNIIDEDNAFIFGGYNSKVYAWGSVSIGGDDNDINSCEESGIFAGYSNTIECTNISYDYGTVIIGGSRNIIDGGYSTIINGRFNEITGSYSTIIGGGGYANVSANKAIIIGSGVSSQDKLINDTESSLMVGFNSNIPTLFVGPSNGVGTTGNVGIGTVSPSNLLTLGAYNSGTSSSLKQGLFSTDNTQLSQLEGGAYFGKVGLKENQWALNNYGNTWTAKDSSRTWRGVAMSSDGKIQTAVVANGQIYISTDYGNTWTAKDSNRNWIGVAMSSDGKIQTAVVYVGQIYISTDYGNTWTAKDSNKNWRGVAMSSDGKIQTAVVEGGQGGQIYISTDYGNTWTAKDSNMSWRGVAMSSDGKIQTATVSGGQIYVSTDYGNTWTAKDSGRWWYGVAMSSDGKIQTAVSISDQIYVSTDYGNTWTAKDSNRDWRGVAMSSDGKIQTAVANGQIYISTDYGNT